MTTSSKRAEYVAVVCLILSIVFFAIIFFIGRWSGFFAVSAAGWLVLAAALIWFVLTLQFHQRNLSEQEKLDMSQLEKDKESPTIFQAKGEHATMFAVAQRQLQVFEKWFLPVFSAIIATYQLGMGLYLLKAILAGLDIETKQPLLCAICMTAIAFVSFLVSRYATGMSAPLQWKPLRAGGSFLLGTAAICFVLAISLALAHFNWYPAVTVIAFVIPILLIVLGAETALNVVLDIYRPRIKGEYSRAAFDSRLLGIISEPGGIFRTAASAIDYQFGFKVSQTWFYRLLEKAIVPLVLFSVVTLYLFSCIVVVNPNEEAIIEHFGNPANDADDVRLIGPGLAFKWPWPIDIAYKYPTKKVMELSIGFVPRVDPRTGEVIPEQLLWGRAHYEDEYQWLVASEQTSTKAVGGAVPVSLVMAAVPVQYRIKDLYSFIYNHSEPEKHLVSICYRELTKFAASAKIEVDNEADLEESLLGAGRAKAKQILTRRIQAAADEAGLGVEIVFLGLQGIHPPADLAADYQKVVGAFQKKQALILGAQAERNRTLSTLVGSVEDADRLYSLAAEYQRAKEQGDQEQIEKLSNDLDTSFEQANGDIFKTLRQAQSYAFEKATLAEATGQRFAGQLKAYRAAPDIYVREQVLSAYEGLPENIRKFIVVADPNDTQIIHFDLQEQMIHDLYNVLRGE
jgi:regulator of protease activity HflC (stomatin/prohibitin superfamily)